MFFVPKFCDGSHVRDSGLPSATDAGIHDASAVLSGVSAARISAIAVPSRAAKHVEALVHSACRVFQPRRRPAELVEFRERGVDVGLVEQLAAVDQSRLRPSNGSAATRLRSPLARSHASHSDDCSEIAQPMHSFDVDADVWRESQVGGSRRSGPPAAIAARAGGRCSPSRRRRGDSRPLTRRRPRDDRPRVRVGGRFAGEVPRVEFLEGGVEVVGVERDLQPRPVRRRRSRRRREIRVSERLGSRCRLRPEKGTNEGEATPRGSRRRRRHRRGPEIGDRLSPSASSVARPGEVRRIVLGDGRRSEKSSANSSPIASQSRAQSTQH